jgi:hypothetical protein
MSFSDTITFIALIFGILAVAMVPFAAYLDSQNKRLSSAYEKSQEAIAVLRRQQQLQAITLDAVSQLATASRSSQQFCEGLIHRLLVRTGELDEKEPIFTQVLKTQDLSIEKAQKRLEMLSDNKQIQLSAFKALAERLATFDCLDAMSFVASDDPDLRIYVTRARKRLTSNSL